MFSIEQREPGVVALAGRFDAAQVERAERVLDPLSGPIVLDLADLEYIASAGIGVILKTLKRVHGGGHTMRLRNPRPHVRSIFYYSGLDQILLIE
jgi:anti-sigma B factor antagonist